MNFFKINIKILLLLFLVFSAVFSANLKIFANEYSENSDNIVSVKFPAGTMFKAILQDNISTSENNAGDEVSLIVPSDLMLGDTLCIPENSKFIGRIRRIEKAQQGRNGLIEVIFETLKFAEGQEISILAHVWTKDKTGILGGELTDHSRYKRVPVSIEGIGNIAQMVPDGPRIMGKETEILVGSEWIIVLDKDLNVTTQSLNKFR